MTIIGQDSGGPVAGVGGPGRSANLGDILERVLDKGLVIAGDIQVNLLDIELLTIKLRLVVASLETAKEVGIDWWEHDPWLRGDRGLERENRELRRRVADLEAEHGERPQIAGGQRHEAGTRAPQAQEAGAGEEGRR